jgi:hypothetical protein
LATRKGSGAAVVKACGFKHVPSMTAIRRFVTIVSTKSRSGKRIAVRYPLGWLVAVRVIQQVDIQMFLTHRDQKNPTVNTQDDTYPHHQIG